MKKLSVMLALLLVLSLALVACGGEEEASSTPEAESSVAATESSEAATESSEATTESSEAVVEDSSEPADESKEDVAVGDENIAAGKTYTHSVLFRQGSAGYDANAPISYPDEDGKSFTDGILPPEDATFTSVEWVGFNGQDPAYEGYHWITVDLGEKQDLAKYVLKFGSCALGAGIIAPLTVEVYVSDDGEVFESVGGDITEDNEASVNGVYELTAAASGRYVQYRFTSTSWAFISEVEVYGAAE